MFCEKTYDFLIENRITNSRAWFAEHRGEYEEYVFEPLAELVDKLAPAVSAIDGQIVTEPKVDRTISRIYRDMRRVRDGAFYRDEMWLSFKRDKHEFRCYPEFFFSLSPQAVVYGCGYYIPTPEAAACIRQSVIDKEPEYLAAQEAYERQSAFSFDGQTYKRSRYPQCDEKQRQWLDRKALYIMRTASPELLFEPELASVVADDFTAVKPVYDFFILAEERARLDRLMNK